MVFDEDLQILCGSLRNLRVFRLACSEITDVGFASVCSLPRLKTLDISKCSKLTNRGFCGLKKLMKLESLLMAYCNEITNVGFTEVSQLPSLKTLDTTGCSKIDYDLSPILPHIRHKKKYTTKKYT